ncbi:MAG TPA: nucleotidyltransferase domain-containing protein [bacterium]|nr:nucleotidyltransferase domain-containing protein [Candidatus Omnitrophota bacterium]HOL95922.1 nucleotidyltransferase domain-containing protein [bacterium]HPP02765.1 nucleotidyltransferase domain-containing protein [bacterium]
MLKNLETVRETVRPAVQNFFEQVLAVFDKRVDSIYLHGSVVTDDYLPGQSDINSLVLFDSFHFEDAQRMQPVVQGGLKKRIVAPLCLPVDALERSTDTFPLEFIEIRDKHVCIHGAMDRMASLTIPKEHLRVKIEEQIRGKLIRLRQIYMEHRGPDRELTDFLVDAQKNLFPVLRNLLRFVGVETPPLNKDMIMQTLETRLRFSMIPLRRIREHAAGHAAIPAGEVVTVYGEYVEVLAQLARWIDRWEQNGVA